MHSIIIGNVKSRLAGVLFLRPVLCGNSFFTPKMDKKETGKGKQD